MHNTYSYEGPMELGSTLTLLYMYRILENLALVLIYKIHFLTSIGKMSLLRVC